MPSKSAPQARLMAAAAHNPKFAAKVGVPQTVATEFNQADKGQGTIKPKLHKPKKVSEAKRVQIIAKANKTLAPA